MAKRTDILEYAILGMLTDSPLHGYELRKRLTAVLGPMRPLSYGSLYPALHRMSDRGWLTEVEVTPATQSSAPPLAARRARVLYALSAEGQQAFARWVNEAGPESWEDEGFAAHLAFFSHTEARARLRILEGRRSRLEERLAHVRESMTKSAERVDAYTLQLQQHGLDGVEREVRWLNELIVQEHNNSNVAATTNTK